MLAGLQRLAEHDGDRLAFVPDLVALHGHEGRCERWRGALASCRGRSRCVRTRTITRRGERRRDLDGGHAPGWDRGADHRRRADAGDRVISRVLGAAGDLAGPSGRGTRLIRCSWEPRSHVQHPQRSVARERDLVGVVGEWSRLDEGRRSPPAFRRSRCASPTRRRSAFVQPPRTMGDRAERDPCPSDDARLDVDRGRGGNHGVLVRLALAHLQIGRRRGAGAGSSIAVINSPWRNTLSRSGPSAGKVWNSRAGRRRPPFLAWVTMTASSAASATAGSDGCTATQSSVQPKIACVSFSPWRAAQPEPGTRLLQGSVLLRRGSRGSGCAARVASDGGQVAQLRRGRLEDGLGQHRVLAHDGGMLRDVVQLDQRADA